MRILNWCTENRPAAFGDFEIVWEMYDGTVVKATVKGIDCESKIFTVYLVVINKEEAKLMGLEPGYNLLVQGKKYENV